MRWEINVLVGVVEKWIVMFDDGEYKIKNFENLKTQGWKYDCGKDYVEIKCDKFFISLQRPHQLVLNECERSHTFKFLI